MIDLREAQKRVYRNKINQGFNTTDVYKDLCYIQGELAEVFEAYANSKDTVGEELADVALYLLGLAEILGIDLEDEIIKKMEKNERRRYTKIDGVNVRISEG